MKNVKRIFSLFIALLMMFGAIPFVAIANDNAGTTADPDAEVYYDIVVHNGFAYDADGNYISSAKAGDEITLVPYDYIGVREFEGWEIWYGYLGEDFDDTAGEQTVIMTDEYLEIEAYYAPGMLEEFHFYLYGYFAGANSETLYAEAPFGTNLGYFGGQYTYSLCEDINGEIGQEIHQDIIQEGKSYWITLSATRSDDVYFGKLIPENVSLRLYDDDTVTAETVDFASATTADAVVAQFKLPPAKAREDLVDIKVEGGWATVNGYGVEKATPGMPLELSADNGPEGQTFKEWKIVYGDIALGSSSDTHTAFIVGSEDVEIEAVFCPRGGIDEIVIDELTAPSVDANCDFDVVVPEDAGYVVHEVNWKLLDSTGSTENSVYLGPNYTYTDGNAYLVEVIVQADDDAFFSGSEDEIDGYVNGEYANVDCYEEDGDVYVSLEYVYTLVEEEQPINVDNLELNLSNYYVGRSTDDMVLTADVAGIKFNANYHGNYEISFQDALGNWIPVYTRKIDKQEPYRIRVSGFALDGYTIENLEAENITLNGFVCFGLEKYAGEYFTAEFYIAPPLNEESYTVWGEVIYDGYDVWSTTQNTDWVRYDCYQYMYVEVAEQSNPEKIVYKFRPNRDGSFRRYLHDGDYILKTTLKTTKTTDEFGKTTLKTTKTTLDLGKTTLIGGKTTLDVGKTTLDEGKTTLKTTLDGGKTTLDLGKTTLDEFVMVNLKTTLKTTQPSKTTGPEKTTKTTLKLRRLGDVNADLNIDQFDYILAKRSYFNTFEADELSALANDANKDGVNDQFDYILIKRHYFETYTIGTRGKTTLDEGKTTLDEGKTTLSLK